MAPLSPMGRLPTESNREIEKPHGTWLHMEEEEESYGAQIRARPGTVPTQHTDVATVSTDTDRLHQSDTARPIYTCPTCAIRIQRIWRRTQIHSVFSVFGSDTFKYIVLCILMYFIVSETELDT